MKSNSNCSVTSSEKEASMLYLPREDPAASESDHRDRGQHGPGDTSEDEDVAESVPPRRSSRLKRPAPRCTLCDSQIREECEGNGRNIPGHSKRARTCLACRVEKRNRYGCLECWAYTSGRSATSLDGDATASVRRFPMYLGVVPSFLCVGG